MIKIAKSNFLKSEINLNFILLFFVASSALALVFAYVAEYIFNFQPCILCLFERKVFFVIIIFSLFGLIFKQKKQWQNIVFFCCLIFFVINAGLSAYHVGVEKKIFKGPSTCSSSNLNEIQNLEELRVALIKVKAVRCDEPQFFFLTLSMAAWNFIYCAFISFFIIFKNPKASF